MDASLQAARLALRHQLNAVIERYAPPAAPDAGSMPHLGDGGAWGWAPGVQALRRSVLGAAAAASAGGEGTAGWRDNGGPAPQHAGTEHDQRRAHEAQEEAAEPEGLTLQSVLRGSADARAPHSAQAITASLGLQDAFEAATASVAMPCGPSSRAAAPSGGQQGSVLVALAAAGGEGKAGQQQEAHAEAMRHAIKLHMNAAWSDEAVKQGVALAKTGQYQDARRCYDKALELQPENADALVARGAAHANELSYAPAVCDLRAALRLDPGSANARRYLTAVEQRAAKEGVKLPVEGQEPVQGDGHTAACNGQQQQQQQQPPQQQQQPPVLVEGSLQQEAKGGAHKHDSQQHGQQQAQHAGGERGRRAEQQDDSRHHKARKRKRRRSKGGALGSEGSGDSSPSRGGSSSSSSGELDDANGHAEGAAAAPGDGGGLKAALRAVLAGRHGSGKSRKEEGGKHGSGSKKSKKSKKSKHRHKEGSKKKR